MLPAIAKRNRLYLKYVGLADVTYLDDNSDGLKGYPAVNCPAGRRAARADSAVETAYTGPAPEWETVVEKPARFTSRT